MMIIVTKRRRYEETRGEAKQRDFLNLSNYYLLSFISLSFIEGTTECELYYLQSSPTVTFLV